MPEPAWTPKAVADTLEEAAQTLQRLPPVRVRGYISSWPVVIREFWEAFGWHETQVRLGPPTPDNDDRADWREAWTLFPGDVAYVWHAGVHGRTVAESLEACGFAIRAQPIWVKSRFVLSRGHY